LSPNGAVKGARTATMALVPRDRRFMLMHPARPPFGPSLRPSKLRPFGARHSSATACETLRNRCGFQHLNGVHAAAPLTNGFDNQVLNRRAELRRLRISFLR
jgi:hypothetical protein